MSKRVYLTCDKDEFFIGSVSGILGDPEPEFNDDGKGNQGISFAAIISDIVSDLVFSVSNRDSADFTIKVK